MYYNYHAVAKRLIREGKLVAFRRTERWGSIAPAFVLFFTDHRPMPIREERVPEYVALIEESPSARLVRGGKDVKGAP
ncbi:MAG: thermostable hemolysin delta-VPH [Clostridia bacterium]|nr:thermostable hemolysin delta-VPH [Clostridia bacterium]